MEPVYLSIQPAETGKQIKRLLLENGYTIREIQGAFGFENPQAIYKWISGKSLPSLDNFIILSRLLHTSIEDILVIDGDIPHFSLFLNLQFNDFPGFFCSRRGGAVCCLLSWFWLSCQSFHRFQNGVRQCFQLGALVRAHGRGEAEPLVEHRHVLKLIVDEFLHEVTGLHRP